MVLILGASKVISITVVGMNDSYNNVQIVCGDTSFKGFFSLG
jgi:hypothetical protein